MPYTNLDAGKWLAKTQELIAAHPLRKEEIVAAVLAAWKAIFKSSIGGFKIGKDIKPDPQIVAFLLHELIPLELAAKYPCIWRRSAASNEKDLVCVNDPKFSIEIKASSHKKHVFGNRSYAQAPSKSKKSKNGYYVTVNFEKFGEALPRIRLIRFGWLDHTDWAGQAAATGQQAHIRAEAYERKLLVIYDVDKPEPKSGSKVKTFEKGNAAPA